MQLGVLPLGTGNDLASANSVTSSHTLCFFGGRSTRGHWSVAVLHCLLQYTGGGQSTRSCPLGCRKQSTSAIQFMLTSVRHSDDS